MNASVEATIRAGLTPFHDRHNGTKVTENSVIPVSIHDRNCRKCAAEAALDALTIRVLQLEAALREIRSFDHTSFSTPFRYEQHVRALAQAALTAD